MPIPLTIDIVSDVVCPWCIIGYRQLMKALDTMPDTFALELRWHPFELNPKMPPEGQDLREHVAMKYGASAEQSRSSRSRLSEIGASLGFEFNYFEGMRMVNTFRAHQLLHWAAEEDKQTALKLALFEAFFQRRQDVNDTAVLVSAATGVGLSGEEARAILDDERYSRAVRAEQRHWLERDVHAVPMFFFLGSYPVPGAQEAETFAKVLRKVRNRLSDDSHPEAATPA